VANSLVTKSGEILHYLHAIKSLLQKRELQYHSSTSLQAFNDTYAPVGSRKGLQGPVESSGSGGLEDRPGNALEEAA
jgi:hypothetical protein